MYMNKSRTTTCGAMHTGGEGGREGGREGKRRLKEEERVKRNATCGAMHVAVMYIFSGLGRWKERRQGGIEGGREGGREGWRVGGREGGREGEREGRRVGGREGEWEGEREGGKSVCVCPVICVTVHCKAITCQHLNTKWSTRHPSFSSTSMTATPQMTPTLPNTLQCMVTRDDC